MLHGYLPAEIVGAISAFGFAARMAFKKLPEIIAVLKCPGDKQPDLMRAIHGLADQRAPDEPESATAAIPPARRARPKQSA